MKKHFTLIFCMLSIVTALITSCGQENSTQLIGREVRVEGGSYWGMTGAQLISLAEFENILQVKNLNKNFLLVNVHTPYAGQIAGTDLFIPYNEIEQNISKLPENKSMKVVVYCYTGYMSISAARTLVKLGFTNVWHLDKGMLGWKRDGYPIIYGSL